jgi:hypothetical protein
VAIERVDHCDLVRICQLRRATVEPFFLQVEVGAADPVPDLESAFACSMRNAVSQQCRSHAYAKDPETAH